MMAVEQYAWVELDTESPFYFFYCRVCPLTWPFLNQETAFMYLRGHVLNRYHARRLELLR